MAFRSNEGKILILATETCAYPGADSVGQAKRLDRVYKMMKERDLDIRRLRLTAICTVCNRAFLKEVNQMNEVVKELEPPAVA